MTHSPTTTNARTWHRRVARYVCCCLLLPYTLAAEAQTPGDTVIARKAKVITNVIMAGYGHTSLLDTYLSAQTFTGTELRLVSHTIRERSTNTWQREMVHTVLLSKSATPSHGSTLLTAMYDLQYGCFRYVTPPTARLQLRFGLMGDATIGGMYNTANGNNPAQARLSLSIDPLAAAAYRFRILNRPFLLQYEVMVPTLGLAFSPAFGQSYYEIFNRNDYDHNIVVTTPFNAPQLHHTLSIDAQIGRTTVRIGYIGDVRQMQVNSLKYHQYTHAIAIGWVRKFTLTPHRMK